MKRSQSNFLKLGGIMTITLLLYLLPTVSTAQKNKPTRKKSQIVYKYNQYVMVTLKDGTEVPARISSVKSKTKSYVRMIGGDKSGEVNNKFIRHMTAQEVTEVRRKKESTASKAQDNSDA